MGSRKLCLITGGNGGIGYEVAKIFTSRGHDVILACRDAQRGEAAVRSLLLPSLAKSSDGRICCVSSELHKRIKPEDANATILHPYNPNTTPWNSMTMYAHTKLYNIWLARYLSQLLRDSAMSVNAASPGFAPATSLSRHTGGFLGGLAMRYLMPWAPFAVTPAEGGRRIAEACLLPANEGGKRVTGSYFSKGAEAEVSAAAQDGQKAEQLWKLSMELTGVTKYL